MKKPFVIGVTGGSGSGKTTFIQSLRETFAETEICVLSQDEYYRPIHEQPVDAEGIEDFDRPKSIDKKAFVKDLKKLMRGKTVRRLEYVFNNAKAKPDTLTFRPAPVLIVEGLFVFHYKKMRPLLDLKIFLDVKENLKVIRRIKRDRVERNYPLDDVLYRYEYHVLPTFEKYILPHRDRADLVINNNDEMRMGIRVIQGFIRDYLRKN